MIKCPFCDMEYGETELVFEFTWDQLSRDFYAVKGYDPSKVNTVQLGAKVYVALDVTERRIKLKSVNTYVNSRKKSAYEDMKEDPNVGWAHVVGWLRGAKFKIEYKGKSDIPIAVSFAPPKRARRRGAAISYKSSASCCPNPNCGQILTHKCLAADREIRIMMIGRVSSGKTVYTTQLLAAMTQQTNMHFEAANDDVAKRQRENEKKLHSKNKSASERRESNIGGFIGATPNESKQEPLVYVFKGSSQSARVILYDIAGEDVSERARYNDQIADTDLFMLFVDPWKILNIWQSHLHDDDDTLRVTGDPITKPDNIAGVFNQIFLQFNSDTEALKQKCMAVLLIKGDYLPSNMLEGGKDFISDMMRRTALKFARNELAERDVCLRSGYVRQFLSLFPESRTIMSEVENRFPAENLRYFVTSALGTQTRFPPSNYADEAESELDEADGDAPLYQFGESAPEAKRPSVSSRMEEQIIEGNINPQHVVDPLCWYLLREGLL